MRRHISYILLIVYFISLSSCQSFMHSEQKKSKKISFALFSFDPHSHSFAPLFNYITEQTGCLGIWGDGVFCYGLWDLNLSIEQERAHFVKNETARKVFVTKDLKNLVIAQLKRLQVENFLGFSEEEYDCFKKLPSQKEQLVWLLKEDLQKKKETRLCILLSQMQRVKKYLNRKDVFFLKEESLTTILRDEKMQIKLLDLSTFLGKSLDINKLESDEVLKSIIHNFKSSEEDPLKAELFDSDVNALFDQKFGVFQKIFGY